MSQLRVRQSELVLLPPRFALSRASTDWTWSSHIVKRPIQRLTSSRNNPPHTLR